MINTLDDHRDIKLEAPLFDRADESVSRKCPTVEVIKYELVQKIVGGKICKDNIELRRDGSIDHRLVPSLTCYIAP